MVCMEEAVHDLGRFFSRYWTLMVKLEAVTFVKL